MGFNTTIFILNDGLHEIEKFPKEFTEKIVSAICEGKEKTFGVGYHSNVVTVMPTAHADIHRVYVTHGNSIIEINPWKVLERTDESYIELLESYLKTATFYIREMRKKIKEEEK